VQIGRRFIVKSTRAQKHTWYKLKRMALLLYVNLIQKRRYSAIGLDLQRKDLAGF